MTKGRFFFLWLVLIGMVLGCAQSEEVQEDGILLGSIFHDNISDSARLRLAAIVLAIDHINQSGGIYGHKLLLKNYRPNLGESTSKEKAKKYARKLYEEDKAVAVMSLFSSLGSAIKSVTDSYGDFIQCNVSASSTSLTNSTDTFYRTVVDDAFQSQLMLKLLKDPNEFNATNRAKIGIYYIDDTYGRGLKDALKSLIKSDGNFTGNFTSSYIKGFSTSNFTSVYQSDLNIYLEAANNGTLDVLILITLKAQAPDAIKYLTDNNFPANLLLGDGTKTSDTFEIAKSLEAWAQTHKVIGTEPDNYAGINSSKFVNYFEGFMGEKVNTYSSSSYDCAFLLGFSLLYAGKKALLRIIDLLI